MDISVYKNILIEKNNSNIYKRRKILQHHNLTCTKAILTMHRCNRKILHSSWLFSMYLTIRQNFYNPQLCENTTFEDTSWCRSVLTPLHLIHNSITSFVQRRNYFAVKKHCYKNSSLKSADFETPAFGFRGNISSFHNTVPACGLI